MTEPRSRHANRLLNAACISAAVLVGGGFFWIVGDVLWHGLGEVSWSLLSEAPSDAGRAGGIAPILLSSALILGICMVVVLPLGLGTAALLAEYGRDHPRSIALIGRSLDVLAAVPSIVFGLFGYAFFGIALGMGFSIASGGLTLACMVLPLLIRAAEAALQSVPDEQRLAAAALGMSRTRTLRSVLIPAAAAGIVAGLILSIGRAVAETAALLFTSGYVSRAPESLLDSGRALSVHIFDLAMNVSGGESRAYASAVVLLSTLLALNLLAGSLGQRLLARNLRTI